MSDALSLTHPTAGTGSTPLTVALPRNLIWTDEHAWSSVLTKRKYLSTGALNIDVWQKQAGRPCTLQGEQDRAWCERGLLATLRAWQNTAGLQMTLNHRGTNHTAIWDTEQDAAVEAEPLPDLLGEPSQYVVWGADGRVLSTVDVDYHDPRPTDPFVVTLKLILLS